MNASPQIVLAKAEDADVLSEVIAQAFHLLAPSIWLIPIAPARREIFPHYFRLCVDDAMARGSVYTTPERTAAALWLSVPDTGPSSPAGYDEALALVTHRWLDRFQQFDALLEKHHPTGRHDHLAILAVHPDHQGRGLGTALLDAHHRRLDQSHQPTATYLEASDKNTRELYLRHGYVLRPNAPIQLPDGPQMWPMWREPPPARRSAAYVAAVQPGAPMPPTINEGISPCPLLHPRTPPRNTSSSTSRSATPNAAL